MKLRVLKRRTIEMMAFRGLSYFNWLKPVPLPSLHVPQIEPSPYGMAILMAQEHDRNEDRQA